MISLTADLHHSSLNTGNQQHCDRTELQVAGQFARMIEEANVKATFFISGKCFHEEWEDVRPIVENPMAEVGGHNWDCFEPELWHRICKKALGSYNGPAWYQKRDVDRTRRIIREKTGRDAVVWRNHMYMHGRFTDTVLAQSGVRICSDGVRRDATGPELLPSGLYNFPINIIPDHEHLYHAERTPEWVEWWVQRYNWSDDFGSASYHIEEWTEIVLDGLRANEERGVISNMIIHPITMDLCDGFRSFERILDYLSRRETVHLTETIGAAAGLAEEVAA